MERNLVDVCRIPSVMGRGDGGGGGGGWALHFERKKETFYYRLLVPEVI